MPRLIFCFFAEDTDIFHGEGSFSDPMEQMSAGDPSKTGEVISELFRTMNIPIRHEGKISNFHRGAARIPNWANVVPYVNGGLFGEPGSADVLVGTANEKANGKAGNDSSLSPHSLADGDVGVPKAMCVRTSGGPTTAAVSLPSEGPELPRHFKSSAVTARRYSTRH